MSGNPYTDSQHLRSAMADRCGRVTGLSFSRGKDSIASWLVLRDEGWDVRPFSYTWIPGGLRVENESLAYYERAFGCPILRLTHPMFYDLIDNGVYQHPGRWAVLDEIGVPQVGYDALNEMAREELGVEWLAMGTRAVDSHRRRIAIERHGPVSEVRRTWQPIYDMRMADKTSSARSRGACSCRRTIGSGDAASTGSTGASSTACGRTTRTTMSAC